MPFNRDLACRPVNPRRRPKDQPRPGVAAQAHQVDLQFIPPVVPGDMTGQHAGIGRGGAGVDDRQPRAGQRVHPPFAQHQRMGVPAANQHQISRQGQIALHQIASLSLSDMAIANRSRSAAPLA